ncbi:alpha/beta fold hydrolase [Nocardiopsis sediminis]|uniref:Alpha/beta fold hydrolase n=1 Tax=Nocardiopsis sediminis TaxID=1778267 RepID=A0ABV8FWF8_9ACTN
MGELRITYDRWGDGAPIVLLHGLGHRRQAWYPVVRRLAADHDVVALDLPGFGGSAPPAAADPYDISTLVATVQRFCDRLGLERPHLVGNSLGGAIALELGARGFAASVTALSPIGFATGRTGAGTRVLARGARLASRVPERVWVAAAGSPPGRTVARHVLRGDPSADAARDLVFDATVLAAGSPFVRLAVHVADYAFTAGAVPCPVTVAWGDRDRVLPATGAVRALRRIPHARIVTLLDCGHVPMADRPNTVAAEILRTCRTLPPKR